MTDQVEADAASRLRDAGRGGEADTVIARRRGGSATGPETRKAPEMTEKVLSCVRARPCGYPRHRGVLLFCQRRTQLRQHRRPLFLQRVDLVGGRDHALPHGRLRLLRLSAVAWSGRHIRMDVLVGMMPPKVREFFELLRSSSSSRPRSRSRSSPGRSSSTLAPSTSAARRPIFRWSSRRRWSRSGSRLWPSWSWCGSLIHACRPRATRRRRAS